MHTRKFSEPSAISVPTTQEELAGLFVEHSGQPAKFLEEPAGVRIQARVGPYDLEYFLTLPLFETFSLEFPGSTQASVRSRLEAEKRRRWRTLYLMFRAKLEIARSGLSSFEHEFFPWIVQRQGVIQPYGTGEALARSNRIWPEVP